jgi:hypothetical protein
MKTIWTYIKVCVMTYIKMIPILLILTFVSFHAYKATKSATAKELNLLAGKIVYTVGTPFLSIVENTLGYVITYGDCRVKNLISSGVLIVGKTTEIKSGQEGYHLRSFTTDGREIENTCPTCYFTKVSYGMAVKNNKILGVRWEKTPDISDITAYVYIRTALWYRSLMKIA